MEKRANRLPAGKPTASLLSYRLASWFLVLCRRSFAAPGRDGRDVCFEPLLFSPIGARSKLYQGVKWHLHPWTLFLRHVQEVRIYAAEDSLVGDYEDVFASFEFHYNWFKTDDDVTVRFSTSIAVVVFVVVTGFKVFRVSFCNFLVSKAIANS